MRRAESISMGLNTASWKYRLLMLSLALLLYSVAMWRLPELISMSLSKPTDALKILVAMLTIPSLFLLPPGSLSLFVRRFGLIVIVMASIKQDMDSLNNNDIKLPSNISTNVAIVTGASSGIGLATVSDLVRLNMTVVMACRSMDKCLRAKKSISSEHNEHLLIPMYLDLADLVTVKAFVDSFKSSFHRLDILVNNAGLIAPEGARTAQGFEMSIGVMHIGHFALTHWLSRDLMRPVDGENRAARVVTVSSAAYLLGDFHDSIFFRDGTEDLRGKLTDNCGTTGPLGLLPCCPLGRCQLTNGYARAKLANLLHMQELQLRMDSAARRSDLGSVRRVVTAAVHPGSVCSNIHANFRNAGPLLRSPAAAAKVVMHAIFSDKYLPGSYIDSMKRAHDLHRFRGKPLEQHLEAYPYTTDMPFVRSPTVKLWSLHTHLWARLGHRHHSKDAQAKALWRVSEGIITHWETSERLSERLLS